ncbi:MAG: S41 family peptidase [Sphingobacterium sp.]
MKVVIQLLFLVIIFNIDTTAQVSHKDYNLDFKEIKNNLPIGWHIIESIGYDIGIDDKQLVSGKPSLRIKSNNEDNPGAGVLIFDIPHNFEGKFLTFSAKIKTEGVSHDGHVGLYGHIKPKVDFKNLEKFKINGTRNWSDWEITLELAPEETDKIEIGLYLIGAGTVWFNNLQLSVDGNNYTEAPVYKPTKDSIYKSNSHVPPFELNNKNQELLKNTALIWGAIKYFHPLVAEGRWNMDAELFKFLPRILSLQSNEQQEVEFINWIESFGEIPPRLKNNPDDNKTKEWKLKTDVAWIAELNYSNNLKKILFQLSEIESPIQHKYIEYFDGPNNPHFKELFYRKAKIKDVGFRMLGLFRYWNIIQYFYPYRYLTEQPWDEALDNFIPLFHRASTFPALDSAYLQLFSKINDGHAYATLSTPSNVSVFGTNNVGFKINIVNGKAIVAALGADSLEREKGLLVGDIISEVNGVPIIKRIESRRPFIPASNEKVALKYMEQNLFQTDEDQMDITFTRDGIERIINIPTLKLTSIKPVPEEKTPPFKILNNRIGYVQAGKFKEKDLKPFLNLMEGKDGLILDYRQYPVDYLHEVFSNYLFPEKKTFVKFTNNKGLSRGEFIINDSVAIGNHNPDYFKGKLIILIDEGTLSAAEFQVMAFQTIPGAKVIGRNSAGADGNISWVPLPFGFNTAFSGIGVYYPDLRETQGPGIVPDLYVEQVSEDIKNNYDRILQTAIDLIK